MGSAMQQCVRCRSLLSPFIPALWFAEAASRFWSRVLQSLLEDCVLLLLLFLLQELDERRFAHFLSLVLDEADELVNLLVVERIVGEPAIEFFFEERGVVLFLAAHLVHELAVD